MMNNYWKRRFNMLVDVLKESHPPGAIINYLSEVGKRMDIEETEREEIERIR